MTNDASSAGGEPATERDSDASSVLPDCPRDPDASSVLPDCPSCGEPIITTTVVGPTDGYAAPCGCRVSPAALPSADDE
ncbi:hypothetical protein [Natrinema amylolyticum]|uniref:hypothetical protein n=1 Tax=Natrinema amylolyticum TaxID=2878679 RepID=UPI001CFA5918|nr:hypothetical protein [Natrinema amylolyticum]